MMVFGVLSLLLIEQTQLLTHRGIFTTPDLTVRKKLDEIYSADIPTTAA